MSRGVQRPAGFSSLVILLLVAGVTLPTGHAVAGSVLQPPPPQASAADRLKEADRLAADHRGAQARNVYLSAAEQARAESRTDLEALAFESLGRLLNGDSQYADAQTFLERALPLAESIRDLRAVARIQTSLGNVAVNRGGYADADAWYRRSAATAEQAGDQRLLANALLNLSLLDMTTAAERDQLRAKVVAIARSTGDTDLEARVWHSRGDWHFADGSYAIALEELQTAATLYEKAGNEDGLASVYTSLGRVSRMHGLPLDAISYYQKALDLQRRADDKIGMVQSLNATGVAYATAGDNDKALTYYERAYALAVESQSARATAFMKGNLAGGLINLGQYARAAELLESLLKDGGDNYPSVRHSQLSIAYDHMGRLEEARANADKAVALAGGTQVIHALVRRAQVRRRQADPAGALEDLQRAADLIEQVRRKLVPLDFMKQGFTTQYLGVYSGMIAIYQGRGEAGRAIEVAESARARAFLDLLATRGILAPKAAKPSDIAQLSATAARTRSTILTYWTTEDELFIGVVPVAGPPQMARVAVASKRLASLVASVAPTPSVSAAPATQATASWKSLYRSLIEPVRRWLPAPGGHLTIIPEGPLMRLPFAALATAAGRYLIEDYSLSYAPAGAMLDATAGRPVAPPAERRFLFVADPRLPPPAKGERALPPLPGALEEVRAIARLAPVSMTTVLANEKATKPVVIGMMPGASVLHFATHGVVNDRAPLDSYLALGPPEPPVADGRLTAQELYGLHLRADLVVLSSCRSAGGEVTGEGIAALARAFLSAGVPAVVASVWDVPDQPSNRLFPVLYTAWLGGGSPARALRAAQLRLIADLRAGKVGVTTVAGEVRLTESPALWAGFIVIGGR
jgi:CHAT domain-containing protein/tetratricopeptide (TPR) repeat protein